MLGRGNETEVDQMVRDEKFRTDTKEKSFRKAKEYSAVECLFIELKKDYSVCMLKGEPL